MQPVSFLLVHCDSFLFHASVSEAVKRNFLLCPKRNLSLCRDTVARGIDLLLQPR